MRDYLPPGSALSVPFIRRGPGAVTRLLRQPGAVGLASPLENSVLSQEEGEVSRTRAGGSGTQCLSGALRNLASDRPLRRRRRPSPALPLPPCAGAQSRAGNLRSGCARSTRWLLLSRATFLGPPRDRLFFSSILPTQRARCREPGPLPFSVSLSLTQLAVVLPPFSVPEAGRTRSTDGKSRSCLPW